MILMDLHRVKSGLADGLPIAVAYFPIAMGFGALGMQYEAGAAACLLMSAIVFAGASQFVAVGLLASGASLYQVVLTTLFMNMRHLVMSASLRSKYRKDVCDMPRALVGALLITDETFAVAASKENSGVSYLLGVGLIAYIAWVSGTLAGTLAGHLIPEGGTESLVAVLYALFIALLVPSVKRLPFGLLTCCVSMSASLILSHWLSSGWVIVLSMVVACCVTGMFLEKQKDGQRSDFLGSAGNESCDSDS